MSSGTNPNPYPNNQYRTPGNGGNSYSQNRNGNYPNQSNRYPSHPNQGNRYPDGRGANSPYANDSYQGAQYRNSQNSNTRYPGYPDDRYSQNQYHQNPYPNNTYPGSRYPNPGYRTPRQPAGHYPGGYGPNIQVGRPGPGMMNGAARAAEHASRLKIIALLSAILVTLGSISTILYNAFLKTGTPEDTLAKFEQAIEKLDQTSYIECFDHQSQKLYSGLLSTFTSVADSLTGWNISGMMDIAEGLGGIMGAAGYAPQVEIDIKDIEYEGDDRCKVYTTMHIQYAIGDLYGTDSGNIDETDDVVFPMVLEDREWKIDLSAMATDDVNLTNSLFGM